MRVYYIYKNKSKEGPYSLEDLRNLDITSDTLIWRHGMDKWVSYKEIQDRGEGLYYLVNEANEKVGPYTLFELSNLGITGSTLVWTLGQNDWAKASNLKELRNIISSKSETGQNSGSDKKVLPKGEKLDEAMWFLSFCIPIVGAGIYFANIKRKPRMAKSACSAAWWGILAGFLLNVIYYALSGG